VICFELNRVSTIRVDAVVFIDRNKKPKSDRDSLCLLLQRLGKSPRVLQALISPNGFRRSEARSFTAMSGSR
jgi:hypothetical protein